MSIWSRVRAGEIFLALLAIGVIIALGVYAAPSHLADPQSSRAGSSYGSPNGSLLGTFNPGIAPIFGPNIRANSDPTQNGQHEPSLAVSRVHTNTVVVASKDYRNSNQKEVWIDVSTDGGATWPQARQIQMPGVNPSMYPLESDPVVMARDDGRIYVSCLAYNNQNAVFITWTDDDGATWQPSVQLAPPDSGLDDKDWFAIDNTPSSPYYHRMYMMYAPQGAAYVAEQHSTDGGLTWSGRHQIGANGTEYTYPVVGSDGTVYDFMMDNWGAGQTGTILLTKSTDGGVSWSPTATVTTAQQPNTPIRGSDQFRFFAILSAAVDPNNGNLFVAWTDNRNFATNGTDVVYVRSTDHGATWSGVTRLSHDPTGVVRDHITPVITIGRDSRLHAFWLDRRLDAANHLWDSWYNSSTDGGVTWEAPNDVEVSNQHQDLNVGLPPGSGGAAGDYWGIDTAQDTVYVAWNDTRSGFDQDIYVAKGLFAGGGGSPTPTALASSTPIGTASPPPTATGAASGTATTTRPPTQTPGSASATPQPSTSATRTVPVVTATSTAAPTQTLMATPTSTALAGCDQQRFTDVPQGSAFYTYVQTLACRGIISGYPCGGPGEPCDTEQRPYFRTNNNVTRGQLSKIVAGAAGFNEPVSSQTFEDIAPGSTFYPFVERLATRGIISGYPCGGPGEPCGQGNKPYFRPNNTSTRGQIAKIASNAAGFIDPQTVQFFQDVPVGSTFQPYIGRLYSRGLIAGYPCGGPGEPCVAPDNLPYFRPNNNATRGQTSKIVSNTFFP